MPGPTKKEESSSDVASSSGASSSDSAADSSPADPQQPSEETAQCPICQFIEAGDCKDQHQAWTACREAAKKEGVDYVDVCHDQFKIFIQCAMDNSEYYEPFLSMLLGDEKTEEETDSPAGSSGN